MIIATRVMPATIRMVKMRNRAFRRHQTYRHMWRRLKEDRNQHYNDLTCPCWTDKKAMARFKEQPKLNQCQCCCNVRRSSYHKGKSKLTMQERRHEQEYGAHQDDGVSSTDLLCGAGLAAPSKVGPGH